MVGVGAAATDSATDGGMDGGMNSTADMSMELKLFKTLWGFTGEIDVACDVALQQGFDGIEGPAPSDGLAQVSMRNAIAASQLDYIAEITTAGSYVPALRATADDHVYSLQQKLEHSLALNPRSITCLAGSDAWPEGEQLLFFERVLRLVEGLDVPVSFETHRSRSLFNPWITQRIAREFPALLFTCDFSHWCVVCERLLDAEFHGIGSIAKQSQHIHARVGFEQGPQVPHPAAPEAQEALAAHRQWWELIWQSQRERGYAITTMTPEFGPDGYLHLQPFTQTPVADLEEINSWMAAAERRHFADWLSRA